MQSPLQPDHSFLFPHSASHLFINLFNLLNDLALSVIFKASSRDLVQPQDLLIRILHKNILALFALQAHIGNGTDDTPSVGEREVHLVGKVPGLPSNDAKDDVTVVCLRVGAGNESVISQRMI